MQDSSGLDILLCQRGGKMTTFWMIYIAGNFSLAREYDNFDIALKETKYLISAKGRGVYLLSAIADCMTPIVWEDGK